MKEAEVAEVEKLIALLEKGSTLSVEEIASLPSYVNVLKELHQSINALTQGQIQKENDVQKDDLQLKSQRMSYLSSRKSSLESTSKASVSGYLRMRLSSKEWRMKTWYCMLYKSHIFWYASKKDAVAARDLKGRVRVIAANNWSGEGRVHTYSNAFTFESKTGQMYFCSAPTAQEQQLWIENITTAANDYLENMPEVESKSFNSGRVVDKEVEEKKTKIVGLSTTTGVAAGALVGSVIPVIGTLIGGVVGGVLSHRAAKETRRQRVAAAVERKMKYEDLQAVDVACSECDLEFHTLKHHRFYCESCFRPFCKAHCKKETFLPQTGESQLKRVCNACFHRQEFITFIVALTSTHLELYKNCKDEYEHLDSKTIDPKDLEKLNVLAKTSSYTVLNVLCLIKKHISNPAMLIRTLGLLIPFCELDLKSMDTYWIQFLGLFVPLVHQYADNQDGMPCIDLFVRFILAVCRRSNHLALRTVWEFLAMYEDATTVRNDYVCGNYILLLVYLVSGFNGNSELVSKVWLLDSPPKQAETIINVMDDFLEIKEQQRYSSNASDTLFAKWIEARSSEEVVSMKKYVTEAYYSQEKLVSLLSFVPSEGCKYRDELNVSSVTSKDIEEEEKIFLSREQQFNDEAVFVDNMTSLAEHLRFIMPRTERKMVLPGLLENLQTKLPNNVYIPLCDATDVLIRLLRVLPNEGKVFSTRCRAPTLIVFEAIKEKNQNKTEPDDEVNLIHDRSSIGFSHLDSKALDLLLCGQDSFTSGSSSLLTDQESLSSNGDVEIEEPPKSTDSLSSNGEVPSDIAMEEARLLYEESTSLSVMNNVDEPETWKEKKNRIQASSEYGHLEGWTLVSVIAKSFDDMRQEVFAQQLIVLLKEIFDAENAPLYLRPYRIMCTGANVGLIETLTDSLSFDGIKKKYGSLAQYFATVFGAQDSPEYKKAQQNFISSMAAYSIYCYLFQIKDRHNGNIMLDRKGHVIHIDFGFMFGIAPGGAFSLEEAPFKLTQELVEIMGGIHSEGYQEFKKLFLQGFLLARNEYIKLLTVVHLTLTDSPYPCFTHQSSRHVMKHFRKRLFLNNNETNNDDSIEDETLLRVKILNLVEKSYNHWGTRQYDHFQQKSNGILP